MTNQNDMAMIARARLEVDALAARVDASSHDSTQLAEAHAASAAQSTEKSP